MADTRVSLTSSELIAAFAACGMAAAEARRRRRKRRLGQAIHELRRPLQALLLSPEPAEQSLTAADLALAALHDLESVLDPGRRSPTETGHAGSGSWQRLLENAAERWRQAAWLRGGRISVQCGLESSQRLPGEIEIMLARALDNLILNSLTHGGATVTVTATRRPTGIDLTVSDRGMPPAHGPAHHRGRQGHGLTAVAAIADRLGGSFKLSRDTGGSQATLHLPRPWWPS